MFKRSLVSGKEECRVDVGYFMDLVHISGDAYILLWKSAEVDAGGININVFCLV